jgi:hypothetical protein
MLEVLATIIVGWLFVAGAIILIQSLTHLFGDHDD